MNEIQARLADINRRAAPVLEEYARLQRAAAKGITLILTLAGLGVFYVAGSMADEHYRIEALDKQEITHHG